MKNYYLKLKLSLLFIIFHNCMYSQIIFENTDTLKNYLEGEWEWISSCGGMAGLCSYSDSSENSEMIIFNKIEDIQDSIQIVKFRDDTFLWESVSEIDGDPLLYWDLRDLGWKIIAESENRIVIRELGADGFDHAYERIISVSVKNKTVIKAEVIIHPNPCTNLLNIRISNFDIIYNVNLYDVDGSVIQSYENYRSDGFIDISQIPKGLYFVKVVAGEMEFVEKFIKQ